MNWFLIALINPLAHAFVNHFDKYLISRFTKEGSVGALVLFSALFSVVVLPIVLVLNPGTFETITFIRAVVLMVNGAFLVLAILFYLYALETHEASHIMPMFELLPVFAFILGYFILGEVLNVRQLWAAGLILLGSGILSLELEGRKTKIRIKAILFVVASSFFYAANAVIFKWIAVEQGFMDSLFWDMLGKVVFGLILFAAIRPFRTAFISLIRTHRHSILGLNVVSEIMGLAGEIALVLAVIYAPVALVQSVGSLQSLFVFLLGIVITLFLPKFGRESLLTRHLAQKVAGIVVITAGVYFLEII